MLITPRYTHTMRLSVLFVILVSCVHAWCVFESILPPVPIGALNATTAQAGCPLAIPVLSYEDNPFKEHPFNTCDDNSITVCENTKRIGRSFRHLLSFPMIRTLERAGLSGEFWTMSSQSGDLCYGCFVDALRSPYFLGTSQAITGTRKWLCLKTD